VNMLVAPSRMSHSGSANTLSIKAWCHRSVCIVGHKKKAFITQWKKSIWSTGSLLHCTSLFQWSNLFFSRVINGYWSNKKNYFNNQVFA
jgi:hypothetical protein